MKKFGRKIALLLLIMICSISLGCGLASCKSNSINGPLEIPKDTTTDRLEVPADGSDPTSHTALENVGYMAYVLDNQQYYHAYAKNSSKAAMGYEQITQTWKDYKGSELSGIGSGVMVCSDLSYSAFVKSATQSCFVGTDSAYMRSGDKPGKNSVATDINWNSSQPEFYTDETYLTKYGEFSTELSVYVINENTLIKADSVVKNSDGTYSQKLYLNSDAACWYQYGMKTRGSLKTYPEFEKIEITFTFDKDWRVLSSYCEEKTEIAPGALGGIPMSSTSQTTTTFDYSQSGFDNVHYSYFDNFFSSYVGKLNAGSTGSAEEEPDFLTVLGNAFAKVVDAENGGQQFNINLTIGDTDYTGKIYLHLADMGDILGSLDVRAEIGKKNSGKQDLYFEFKNGAVNVYYSDGFAMTADINSVAGAVGKITDWFNSFNEKVDVEDVAYALTGESEQTSLDLTAITNELKFTYTDTTATIKLLTDDLLGLGIGLNVQINIDRTKDENGSTYTFKSLNLSSVTYNTETIKLSGTIVPDDTSPVISRNPAQSTANLTDYINGIYNLLDSESYSVDISLDGSCESISYINGLVLNAQANIKLGEGFKNIAVRLPMTVNYNGLSAGLEAYYTINLSDGNYGEVYLNLTSINGKEVSAKVYCDISEVITTVTSLIDKFTQSEAKAVSYSARTSSNSVAEIVNSVLSIDYAKLITELKADKTNLKVNVNPDIILQAFGIDLGFEIGTVSVTATLKGEQAVISGKIPSLGFGIEIAGSDKAVTAPDPTEYLDLVELLNGISKILDSTSFNVNIDLDGSCDSISYINGLKVNTDIQVQFSGNFNVISVNAPISVDYNGISAELCVYYTIDINSGNYGEVYLNLTSVNGKAVSVKVYCDISEIIPAVQQLIGRFVNTATYANETDTVANVVSTIASIDFEELINTLEANAEGITVDINLDKIVDFGISLGNLQLALVLNNGELKLNGKLLEFGLTLGVAGSDRQISVPNTDDYLNLVEFVVAIGDLLDSTSFNVNINLDGSCDSISYINGLKVNTDIQVQFGGNYNVISVNAPVSVDYNGISAELSVYYTIDINSGNYGEVYLNLTSVNGKAVSVKVYCDISEIIPAVQQLIGRFVNTATYANETDTVANVVSTIASIDFEELINTLEANAEGITVDINLDKIVDFGISLGNVQLALVLDNGELELNGKLPEFGLTLGVAGSDREISVPDTDDYLNLVEFVVAIGDLLDSTSFNVNINLDGSCDSISYINGLKVNTDIQVQFSGNYSVISVNAPISVDYNGISAEFCVYYTIDINSGNYGEVYLNLTSVNGKAVSVKVYCDISEIIPAVQQLIGRFVNTATYANETDTVANVVSTIANIDFEELINTLEANAEGITVDINLDKIVDFGISLGNVQLALLLNNGGLELNGKLPEFGLTLGVAGSDRQISVPNTDDYLNLVEFVVAIGDLLDSTSFNVNIDLDGSCDSISYINGLTLNTNAQLQLAEDYSVISVNAPITVTYGSLSADIIVYYTINLANGDYGDVYLHLTRINDTSFNARVCCNVEQLIESVKMLINLFTSETAENGENANSEEADKIAGIIDTIVNIRFEEIIYALEANADGITAEINLDKIVDFGISIGNVQLALVLDNGELTLNGKLPEFGLTLGVEGSDKQISAPDADKYINLYDLVLIIQEAYNQANSIIEAQDIQFTLNGEVTLDGVVMTVDGKGEVSWKNGKLRVAADAVLTIYDTAKQNSDETSADVLKVKFVYDETSAKLVRLAINDLGIEFGKDDIDGVASSFNAIISAVENLLASLSGKSEPVQAASYSALSGATATGEKDYSAYLNILNKMLGEVSKLTLKLTDSQITDAEVKDLLISYANNLSIVLSANGGLSLDLDVNGLAGLTAKVTAGNGGEIAEINQLLDGLNLRTVTDQNSLIKVIYEYFFDVFEDLSVENVLGGNTYTVKLALNGGQSGIDALDGINVNANLYFTDKNVSNGKKLVQTDLDLDIKGTSVKVSVYLSDKTVYLSLTEVAGTAVSDIALKASVYDIYSAVEAVVKIITSDTLLQIIDKMTGNTEKAEVAAVALSDGETSLALEDVLNKILSLDFNQLVSFEKLENGVTNLTVNTDELIAMFGSEIKIGTVYLTVDAKTHSIFASVNNGEKSWLTLDAQVVENSAFGTFSPDDSYIDIGFVTALLDDILATLESLKDENGNVNIIYSLTGTISLDIKYSVISGSITFENTVLTVGFDEDGEFYFSLTATLSTNKANLNILVSIGTVNITTAGQISITYSKGYLTFGRDGDYKVMTLDYFLDNALDYTKKSTLSYSNNSPIAWLLGTNDLVWGMVCENIPVELSSGLTEPHTIGLYELAGATQESKDFHLSSILNGFEINADGKKTNYNTCDAVGKISSKLGLEGDYYAFDINAGGLTGGVISTLYAAVLSGEDGINGIKAITNVAGALDLSVNLDSRASENAKDYLKVVTENHDIDFGYSQSLGDHKTNVFGCYDTKSNSYSYTTVLDSVTLNVIDFNGETETYELRYGSTVYLTNVWAPEWVGGGKTFTVIYTDINGNEVGVPYTDSENNVLGKLLVLDESLFGEGEHEFTIIILKAEGNTPEREITFHIIGVDGLTEVNAAFAVNDGAVSLFSYKIDGYIMLHWYTDEACTTELTSEIASSFTDTDVYCLYVKDTTTINGVIYKFYNEDGNYVYHVNGFVESSLSPYTQNGKTLVLENEIVLGGVVYKVTEIDANAFKEAMLKNVVVPENIVLVGENAFINNYSIETVVFLADRVGFCGTYSGKTYPFYGCSVSDGSETTLLNLYYNEIYSVKGEGVNKENNPYWSHFRSVSSTKLRYIGNDGGARVSENWAYVEFSLNRFATELPNLNSGISTTAYTQQQLQDYVTGVLNGLTYANGYINAYKVEISGGLELNKSRYTITVTITDLPSTEWCYELNLSAYFEGEKTDITAIGTTKFNDKYFALAGTEVQIRPVAGLQFAGVQTDENGYYVFIMPASKLEVNLEYEKQTIKEITVLSAVDYLYGGTAVSANTGYAVKLATDGNTTLEQVSADGYLFLGWAYDYDSNGNLMFTDSTFNAETVKSGVYYAVWAVKHENVSSVSVLTDGTAPSAAEVTATEGTFYKWYTDSTFAQEVTNITVENSVLTARMQYVLKVDVNGTKCRAAVIGSESKTSTLSGSNSISKEYVVYEGETLYLKNLSANLKDYTIGKVVDGVETEITGQINIKITSGLSTKATEISATLNNQNIDLVSDGTNSYSYITVTGNLNYIFAN